MHTFQAQPVGLARLSFPFSQVGFQPARALLGVLLAVVVGFLLAVVTVRQVVDTRDRATLTREVTSRINDIAKNLLAVELAVRGFVLTGAEEHGVAYRQARAGVELDLAEVRRLTADDPQQAHRIGDLQRLLSDRFARLDAIKAFRKADGLAAARDAMLGLDDRPINRLLGEMRTAEDARLTQHIAQELWSARLALLALGSLGVLVFGLVVLATIVTNRALVSREVVLQEKNALLAQQNVLLREVDHRVRNSLTMIYTLLTFQQSHAQHDSEVRQRLGEAANQVLTVTRVHERLYKSSSLDRVDVGAYLHDLCADLAHSYFPADRQSALRVWAASAEVRAEDAISLGLIAAELVTNACKYATPTVQAPVEMSLAVSDNQVRLTVADHGRGLPKNFDLHSGTGLGMQLVQLLVRQLHGELAIDRNWPGARFTIAIPAEVLL